MGGGRFTADQAVQVCQDAIRQQAIDRFGARQVVFRRINMDDNPGRRDWVVGMVELRRRSGMDEHFRFSCSVNFDTGRLRSANIEAPEGIGGAERDTAAYEMQACQQAVSDRLRNDGYGRMDFGNMNVANRHGNDWVTGTVQTRGGLIPETFEFSCSMSPGSSYVQSTNVRRR
jgi:hypothetical protein